MKLLETIWRCCVLCQNNCLLMSQLILIFSFESHVQWIGMGNQELLDYFSLYNPVRAQHSYGPQGHRGMSILIFENSAMGYVVAKYLHNHFREQGTDRDAWDQCRVLFCPGGIRQLYGYMAEKRDLDIFNQHCHGSLLSSISLFLSPPLPLVCLCGV